MLFGIVTNILMTYCKKIFVLYTNWLPVSNTWQLGTQLGIKFSAILSSTGVKCLGFVWEGGDLLNKLHFIRKKTVFH